MLHSRNSRFSISLAGCFALSGCLSNGTFSFVRTDHLTFLNYNTPTTVTLSSTGATTISPVLVAIQNGASQTQTSGSYAISLGVYSDPNCTNSLNTTLGTPTMTINGVATIVSQAVTPQPNIPFYIKATTTGLTSACSSSLTFKKAPVNLVVPIEMLDLGASLASFTNLSFTRSQTSLDTQAYDGIVSYFFEVVAEGGASGISTVILENNIGVNFAQFDINPGTTPTRYRTSFSPTTGVSNYRVKLIGPSSGMLKVHAARIIVQQTGATRTKIYIPMLNGPYNAPSALDATGANIITGTNNTYAANQTPNVQTYWTYTSGAYSTLSPLNPWSLEVVWSTTAGNTVSAALFDLDAPGIVPGTEVSSNDSSGILLQNYSFPTSALISGHRYQVASKSSSGTSHYLYRAGLWVSISDLSTAEVYHRFMGASAGVLNGAGQADQQRILLDASLFSNPTFFIETTGNAAAPAYVDLGDCGANDAGLSCTNVGGAVTYLSLDRYRSTTSFNVTNGNRYIFSWNSPGVSPTVSAGFVVINVHR